MTKTISAVVGLSKVELSKVGLSKVGLSEVRESTARESTVRESKARESEAKPSEIRENAVLRRWQDHFPQIGARVWLDPSAVIIGDVQLADDVSIWPLVAIRGDVNFVRVGARSNIQDGTVIHVVHRSAELPDGFSVVIGEDVTVGHKAMLHGCTIGNRVLVGMGSIVLDGAVLEDEVLLGAGSLVPPGKRLVSGYLYVGSPAKQIRPLSQSEREELLASAGRYAGWKNAYLDGWRR